MIGLDAAGKTTILYRLKLSKTVTVIPTIGFNIETITPGPGLTFDVWDIGYSEKLRPLSKHYYPGTQGFIFVVDSQDQERFSEARELLHDMVYANEMDANIPILILANKQDLAGAHDVTKLIDELQLRDLTQNPWHIQGACATTGDGLYEGLIELSNMIREYKKAVEMGLLMSRVMTLFKDWSQGSPSRVLMLGLDAAGKTTCLYKLKLNETVTTIPTIGFNVETVTPVPGLSFTVWDVGGQEKIRALWRHYYYGTHGVIFVVDSQDRERFAEARGELLAILQAQEMTGNVPVLILANKQDLPGAHGVTKLIDELQLRNLTQNPWHIQGACATTGDGLYEGLQQLSKMIREFKKSGGKVSM
nr:uncharacterized protein LOC129265594 [Lytechinus pictus]